jgi:hypothetical protein
MSVGGKLYLFGAQTLVSRYLISAVVFIHLLLFVFASVRPDRKNWLILTHLCLTKYVPSSRSHNESGNQITSFSRPGKYHFIFQKSHILHAPEPKDETRRNMNNDYKRRTPVMVNRQLEEENACIITCLAKWVVAGLEKVARSLSDDTKLKHRYKG